MVTNGNQRFRHSILMSTKPPEYKSLYPNRNIRYIKSQKYHIKLINIKSMLMLTNIKAMLNYYITNKLLFATVTYAIVVK